MATEADLCPHCGIRLPAIRDAFCPECRNDLGETAAVPGDPAESATPSITHSAEMIARGDRFATRYGGVLSVMLFSLGLLMILQAPELELVWAWGRRPLGLNVRAFAVGLFVLVFVPIPWLVYHFVRIAWFAIREGESPGGLVSFFLYCAGISRRAPHLASSVAACGKGVFYLLCMGVAWWVWRIYRLG